MFYPSKKKFKRLAKRGNLIPVYKEVLTDLDTPVSAFLKIDRGDYSYLLESVEGGEKIARFSFLGTCPSLVFKAKGKNIEIIKNGIKKKFTTRHDPLYEIKKIMSGFKFVKINNLPRFCGGLVGYVGYDAVRFFEKIPDKNRDDLKVPDFLFLLADTLLIFDHIQHKIKIVSNAYVGKKSAAKIEKAFDFATKKIEHIERLLRKSIQLPKKKISNQNRRLAIDSNFGKEEFKEVVKNTKKYIKEGDIIQAVLSQRFRIKSKADDLDIYRALRSINPSPYMFYLKFKGIKLIGSSPEVMVRCEDGKVELRPIAGTRQRGETQEQDNALEKELLEDPKERAEHIMLVDLGRNDIGRVCRFKSVKVDELMVVEKYSHVMHIVSNVIGDLRKDRDIYDLLRATFPAGTVTGAPKIRAMEIVDELENTKRGPYAGCVGYFSFSGNFDSCITIRTILIKENAAYIQAGAGIVADSVPEREYEETRNKAKALIKAIEMAEKGLEQ